MQFDTANLIPVLPEIFLLTATSVILILDLFLKDRERMMTYLLSQLSLLVTVGIIVAYWDMPSTIVFDGSYVKDGVSDLLKLSILLVSFGVFVYSKDYLKDRDMFSGEFYVLGMFAILGMMIMVSANNFLVMYLGLELLSLSLYAMVAFNRESSVSSEAAMKYFILGALASGMLLYGISMVYGATGHLGFSEITAAVAEDNINPIVMVFGIVFVVIGLAFKLGAVPFHMWVPDVYDGALTTVTLFIGSAPKIAALAMAMRVLVDGLSSYHADWSQMLIILAVLSMAIGNIVAIAQTNIKRMLAYSTISHVGFIMLGLIAGTEQGLSSAMFYTITYAMMALAGFGMIMLLARRGFEAENIHDLNGLNQRSPWFAGMMLLVMFSMAGVPPTVGFFSKMFVLEAVIRADMTWLAIVAVFFSIIGAFYYLRIVKAMYFDKPVSEDPITASTDTRLLLSANGLSMLALGIYPTGLMALCITALN